MWDIWEHNLLPKTLKTCQSPINCPIWSHCITRRKFAEDEATQMEICQGAGYALTTDTD